MLQIPTASQAHLLIFFEVPSSPNDNMDASKFKQLQLFIKPNQGSTADDNTFRNSRFKMEPIIKKGAWVVRKMVGEVPCLLGNKLTTTYYFFIFIFLSFFLSFLLSLYIIFLKKLFYICIYIYIYIYFYFCVVYNLIKESNNQMQASAEPIRRTHVPPHSYYSGERYFEIDVDVNSTASGARIFKMVKGYAKSLVVDLIFWLESKTDDELPEQVFYLVSLSFFFIFTFIVLA